MGLSTYGKNLLLGAYPEKPYVQLHTGDPGAAGTSNKAGEETRKQVTLGAASEGARKNTSAPEWTGVSKEEEYAYVSYWDAATGGNFIRSDQMAAKKAVSKGDSFKFAAGELELAAS